MASFNLHMNHVRERNLSENIAQLWLLLQYYRRY